MIIIIIIKTIVHDRFDATFGCCVYSIRNEVAKVNLTEYITRIK